MKNVFNKTNAPYLVSGALAIGTLLASGVFAIAPYVGFLAPVAALSLGLPFVIGGAIFSAVVIALSAVAISKNNTNTISQQEKFESRVAQRKEEEAKARGPVPDIIALPHKNAETQQEKFESRVAQRKQEKEMEREELKAEGKLPDIIALPYKLSSVPDIIALPYKDQQKTNIFARVWNSFDKMVQKCTFGTIGAKGELGILGGAYTAVNNTLGVADNLPNAVGNPANSVRNRTLTPGLSSTNPTYQQIMQSKVDESAKKLADAKEFAKSNFSIPRGTNDSEPQWYRDLRRSETMEEIMGGGVLSAMFSEKSNSTNHTYSNNTTTSDYLLAKRNATESTCTGVSDETVESNQTALATRRSSVDTSGTRPIENNSSPFFTRVWNKLPPISSLNPFGSRNVVESNQTGVATRHSSIDTSGTCPSQGVYSKREHLNSDETGLNQTTTTKEEDKRCDIANNPLFSKVGNGINTSKQQGTIVDSVELKRLTKELPPSAYPNGSPRVL